MCIGPFEKPFVSHPKKSPYEILVQLAQTFENVDGQTYMYNVSLVYYMISSPQVS